MFSLLPPVTLSKHVTRGHNSKTVVCTSVVLPLTYRGFSRFSVLIYPNNRVEWNAITLTSREVGISNPAEC